MPESFAARWRIVQVLGHQRYLLFSLVVFLAVFPVLTSAGWSRTIVNGLLTLIVITGPASLAPHRRAFLISVSLAVLTWLSGWVAAANTADLWSLVGSLSAAAFFGNLCVLLFSQHLFGGRRVDQETLIAAVNAYLALGLMFAFLFFSLQTLIPDAFHGDLVSGTDHLRTRGFVYYSFVTLTTLGYGDVTPAHPAAATLAYLEALAGQLYVAFTIAGIVGIYISQHGPSETDRS